MKHFFLSVKKIFALFLLIFLCVSFSHGKHVDLNCLIVDLKYNIDKDNTKKLKILEFGILQGSEFQGYHDLFYRGKVWENFWNKITAFNLPIWYVGHDVDVPREIEKRAFQTLESIGGTCIKTVEDLAKNNHFKTATPQPIVYNGKPIGNYKGIIVLRNGIYRNEFKKRYNETDFIIVNDTTWPYGFNKLTLAQLFDNDTLKQYKPEWNTYPKKYSRQLTRKINKDFLADQLVIKPVNSSMGKGIIIVDKKNLRNTLHHILRNNKKLAAVKDQSYAHWAKDTNDTFLVESFEKSKPVEIENKLYDGTMRVIFMINRFDQNITTEFLGSYWKLPYKSLSDTGTLTEKYKSKVNKSRAFSSAKVNPEDEHNVQQILQKILPKIYKHIMKQKIS